MSCVDSKNKVSETKVIKLGNSEDTVTLSLSGKPCIDFQPDDRWHIKDDKSPVKAMLNTNELKNGSPSRRSKRLRSSKSNDSNSASVNGETAESASDNENITKEELVEITEKHPKKRRKTIESQEVPHVNVKIMKTNDSNNVTNEMSNNSLKNENSNSMDVDENPDKKIIINDCNSESSKCASDEKNSKDIEDSNDKIVMPSLSPATSEFNNESSKSTKDNLNETVQLEESEIDNNESKDDICEITINNEEDIPSLEKSADLSQASSEADVNGSDSKDDADIEIININDDTKAEDSESDSECQIINPEALETLTPPLIPTDFSSAPVTDVHYTLTAGFPFYNSLKEKISNFKAGDFKPVKFPHTGTLLLGEKEVIIESPSLLVPLLIKEADEFPKFEGQDKKPNGPDPTILTNRNVANKRNFFQSSVGQFLINLGNSRVQEFYQQDVKRGKVKKLKTVGGKDEELENSIKQLETKLDELKKSNAAFNFRIHRCKFCSFKSESLTVMEGHYLTPHITPRREYKCNFCSFVCRATDDIVIHYGSRHKKKAVIDKYIAFHECIFCSFQSHLKNKVNAHMTRCRKHFIPSQNLSPPFDFEFPGVTTKPVTINDVIGHRRMLLNSAKNPRMPDDPSVLARKKLSSVLKLSGQNPYDLKNPNLMKQLMAQSQMSASGTRLQLPPGLVITQPRGQFATVRAPVGFQGARGLTPMRGVPPRTPFATNLTGAASQQLASSGISITPVSKNNAIKSTSITKNLTLTPVGTVPNRTVSQKPGPPQPMALFTNVAGSKVPAGQSQPRLPAGMQLRPLRPAAPYQRLNTPPSQVVKGAGGNTFVVCEICDSYIKDLEELRTHMNWVHKVKIHPKMLVSRPPLNCQKCHWRFFTDQGLERHLLGAHGLVTTNMQEMANKNQDGGRCIICGAVFTYKLVSHMTLVHKVTLKPAHLSYKCTVCTATFTLYRLFESHVYNVHSGNKKGATVEIDSPAPELAKKAVTVVNKGPRKCKDCGFVTENMHDHLIKTHLKDSAVKLCKIEKCKKCLNSSDEMLIITMADFGIEESDDSGEDSEDSSEESEDSNDEGSKNDKESSSKTGDQDKKSEKKV